MTKESPEHPFHHDLYILPKLLPTISYSMVGSQSLAQLQAILLYSEDLMDYVACSQPNPANDELPYM